VFEQKFNDDAKSVERDLTTLKPCSRDNNQLVFHESQRAGLTRESVLDNLLIVQQIETGDVAKCSEVA
jgi:hypothetical protein